MPEIGPDERAAIALALGKARKRRHPDVVTLPIPPKYACTIAFEQKEFGLAKHLTVRVPPAYASNKRVAEAVIAIAEAFGFTRSTVLSSGSTRRVTTMCWGPTMPSMMTPTTPDPSTWCWCAPPRSWWQAVHSVDSVHGGLLNRETIRSADELRVLILRYRRRRA